MHGPKLLPGSDDRIERELLDDYFSDCAVVSPGTGRQKWANAQSGLENFARIEEIVRIEGRLDGAHQ